MLGESFEDYYRHERRDHFDLICAVKAYDQYFPDKHDWGKYWWRSVFSI